MTSGWDQLRDDLRRALFLPPEGSTLSVPLDHLHFFVILTTFGVFAAIMLAANWFLVRYRRRHPGQRGQDVQGGALYEVLIIGVPLSLFLVWFGIGYQRFLELQRPPPDSMEIYVSAKQWMWKFDYPDGPSSIGVLAVPVGRPVKLLMTSRDVIHSFFVPAFREKKDVLPGRYTELWFEVRTPGIYDILCTQYCGAGHSSMRGSVVALPPEQFDAWLDEERQGLASRKDFGGGPVRTPPLAANMLEQGQQVAAQKGCFKCHTIDGTPHIGPTFLGLYGRREVMTTGARIVADDAYLTESMMDPLAKIVAGYQPVMPTFQGRISEAETAAVLEYIKSLRDPALQARPSLEATYEPRGR